MPSTLAFSAFQDFNVGISLLPTTLNILSKHIPDLDNSIGDYLSCWNLFPNYTSEAFHVRTDCWHTHLHCTSFLFLSLPLTLKWPSNAVFSFPCQAFPILTPPPHQLCCIPSYGISFLRSKLRLMLQARSATCILNGNLLVGLFLVSSFCSFSCNSLWLYCLHIACFPSLPPWGIKQ